MGKKNCILRVALKAPLHELFDYLPPADSATAAAGPAVGQRVRVPFGNSERIGIIAALTDTTDVPTDKLKPAKEILDSQPLLEAELVALLNWSANYYQHPHGDVFAAALPAPLRKGAAPRGATETWWTITSAGAAALAGGELKRARVQQQVLDAIATQPDGLNNESLATVHQGWQRAVRELHNRSLVDKTEQDCIREPLTSAGNTPAPELNEHQRSAVDQIHAGEFAPWLLEGVTGSGKTEVYLHLIEEQIKVGKQSLVLVPEIGLTPQLVDRFRERLKAPVAVMHSNLTDNARLQAWLDVRSGEAAVLIGTRSAIFASIPKLGLIVVDEEHDGSYKQQEGFRYSARDLALFRAHQLQIPVVLGSATPSFESLANVKNDRYRHLTLPNRAGGAAEPKSFVIDMRLQPPEEGLTPALISAIDKHLKNQGQVLIYLNRRGFAPTLFCTTCGICVECKRCDARLVLHKNKNLMVCHHCGHESRPPEHCHECHGELHPVGVGTERIEQALAQHFPDAPLVRLDRDSIRKQGALEETLTAIRSGKARILLGTQMLTKGHDFPDVTMVGIIDADQGLFGTDFRAPERMAQSLVQVAGRAGRADRPGEVWLQTAYPEHPLLQTLLTGGYPVFAREALEEREQTQWPPYSHLALLRAEANNQDLLNDFLRSARQLLPELEGLRILGPASAPMERRSGRWRAQLLLQSPSRPVLQNVLTQWRHEVKGLRLASRTRWSIDVDPIELF